MAEQSKNLREVTLLFLRLGVTAFGGPAAHIALMRDEVVRRRGWLTDQEFLDMVGATNLIPGPNSTEMAIHLGHRRAGWAGLAAAGALFILPATAISLALAIAYVEFQSRPQLQWLLYGVKPAIIAIILAALWGLGRPMAVRPRLLLVAAGVLALYLMGVNEILLLIGAGALNLTPGPSPGPSAPPGHPRRGEKRTGVMALLLPSLGGLPAVLGAPGATAYTLTTLFLNMLKIGSVLYGSGYVLLAYLRADFVERLGWLTERQLLDAIVVGQVTPGPVLSTVTFVGYIIGGWPAAVLATLGIFLPSFIFVGLLTRILPLVKRSGWARAVLDGVNAASLGLMAGVTWQLGSEAISDWLTIVLALASLALVFRTRVNSAWVLLGCGAVGVAYQSL